MKKVSRNLSLLLCAGVLSLCTMTAQAQSKARMGIKGGVNFSNLYTNTVTDRNARVGWHAGFYGQLWESDFFTIQPEVNFSTKGNQVHRQMATVDQTTRFNLNYIDIPVLAVFKLGQVAEIHAGPYWGYLLGANIKSNGDLGSDFSTVDRKNFQNWDYGLAGGIGFNLGGIQLGARYNYGLRNVASSTGARTWLGHAKNSVAQFYLAFNLNGNDHDSDDTAYNSSYNNR